MKPLLVCAMFLMPPSIQEVQNEDRIEFKIPSGFGIDEIRVIAPHGMEQEGRREAQALFDELHRVHTYYINDGDIEVTVKQSTKAMEIDEVIHFANILGIQSRIRSIDSSL